jgi:hypothetical protein
MDSQDLWLFWTETAQISLLLLFQDMDGVFACHSVDKEDLGPILTSGRLRSYKIFLGVHTRPSAIGTSSEGFGNHIKSIYPLLN